MKRLLKKCLATAGYRIDCTKYIPRQLLEISSRRTLEFDDVVCRWMAEVGPGLRFIQVGVYDGVTHDPLHKYIRKHGWRGVLVEPQVRSVAKLQELYADYPDIIVVQAALDAEEGMRTLYTIEGDDAPSWAGGLASFQRETILKHAPLIPGLEGMLREEAVPCVGFDQIIAQLGESRLDILQIDTEGADGYILSLFPFDQVKPAIIQWEVKHLSTAQQEECMERLANYGYRFASSGGEDMMALLF
ncbi:FkbM family methyltransferase [bacterium]|nr:FkbM family methyltransferase [bacterium]